MENSDLIVKTLNKAGKPLKGGEISELSGLDKKTVDSALKDLQKQGKVFSPKRCYYATKKN